MFKAKGYPFHLCELKDFGLNQKQRSTGLKRLYEDWLTVDYRAKYYTPCFKTNNAILDEKERQKLFPGVIHPYCLFRLIWETMMYFVYLITFIVVPLEACNVFYRQLNKNIQLNFGVFMVIIHTIYIFDIFLNFVTGYEERTRKKIFLDRKIIIKKYLKTYFFIDVLSTVPALMNCIPFYFLTGKAIEPRLNILNFLKLFRLFTFNKYIRTLSSRYLMKNVACSIICFVLRAFLFFHWAACLLFVIPFIRIEEVTVYSSNSWLHLISSDLSSKNFIKFYQSSLFHAANIMLSSAIMKRSHSVHELITAIIFVCLGIVYNCYLFIRVLHIIRMVMEPETKYDEFISELQDYMRYNQLPSNIQQRLYTFFEYRYQRIYFREDAIMNTLSERIYKEVNDHGIRRMFNQNTILSKLSKEVQENMIKQLIYKVFLPKDVIIKGKTRGKLVYFLVCGTAAVYTLSGKEVRHLYDGTYFGEVFLLAKDLKMIVHVLALEMCEVYLLDTDVFLKAVATNPRVQDAVIENATQQFKEIIATEQTVPDNVSSSQQYI